MVMTAPAATFPLPWQAPEPQVGELFGISRDEQEFLAAMPWLAGGAQPTSSAPSTSSGVAGGAITRLTGGVVDAEEVSSWTPEEAAAQTDRALARIAQVNPELAQQIASQREGGQVEDDKGFLGELWDGVAGVFKTGVVGIVDIIDRASHIVPEVLYDTDESIWKNVGDALSGESDIRWRDVLEEKWGWERSWMTQVAGFVGDVATDPLTYMTFGLGGVGRQMVGKTAMSIGIEQALRGGTKAGSIVMDDFMRVAADDVLELAAREGIDEAAAATKILVQLTQAGQSMSERAMRSAIGKVRTLAGKAAPDAQDYLTWATFKELESNALKEVLKMGDDLFKVATTQNWSRVTAEQAAKLGVDKKAFDTAAKRLISSGSGLTPKLGGKVTRAAYMEGRAAGALLGGVRLRMPIPMLGFRFQTGRILPFTQRLDFQVASRFFAGMSGGTRLGRLVGKGEVSVDAWRAWLEGGMNGRWVGEKWVPGLRHFDPAAAKKLGNGAGHLGGALYKLSDQVGSLTARFSPSAAIVRGGGWAMKQAADARRARGHAIETMRTAIMTVRHADGTIEDAKTTQEMLVKGLGFAPGKKGRGPVGPEELARRAVVDELLRTSPMDMQWEQTPDKYYAPFIEAAEQRGDLEGAQYLRTQRDEAMKADAAARAQGPEFYEAAKRLRAIRNNADEWRGKLNGDLDHTNRTLEELDRLHPDDAAAAMEGTALEGARLRPDNPADYINSNGAIDSRTARNSDRDGVNVVRGQHYVEDIVEEGATPPPRTTVIAPEEFDEIVSVLTGGTVRAGTRATAEAARNLPLNSLAAKLRGYVAPIMDSIRRPSLKEMTTTQRQAPLGDQTVGDFIAWVVRRMEDSIPAEEAGLDGRFPTEWQELDHVLHVKGVEARQQGRNISVEDIEEAVLEVGDLMAARPGAQLDANDLAVEMLSEIDEQLNRAILREPRKLGEGIDLEEMASTLNLNAEERQELWDILTDARASGLKRRAAERTGEAAGAGVTDLGDGTVRVRMVHQGALPTDPSQLNREVGVHGGNPLAARDRPGAAYFEVEFEGKVLGLDEPALDPWAQDFSMRYTLDDATKNLPPHELAKMLAWYRRQGIEITQSGGTIGDQLRAQGVVAIAYNNYAEGVVRIAHRKGGTAGATADASEISFFALPDTGAIKKITKKSPGGRVKSQGVVAVDPESLRKAMGEAWDAGSGEYGAQLLRPYRRNLDGGGAGAGEVIDDLSEAERAIDDFLAEVQRVMEEGVVGAQLSEEALAKLDPALQRIIKEEGTKTKAELVERWLRQRGYDGVITQKGGKRYVTVLHRDSGLYPAFRIQPGAPKMAGGHGGAPRLVTEDIARAVAGMPHLRELPGGGDRWLRKLARETATMSFEDAEKYMRQELREAGVEVLPGQAVLETDNFKVARWYAQDSAEYVADQQMGRIARKLENLGYTDSVWRGGASGSSPFRYVVNEGAMEAFEKYMGRLAKADQRAAQWQAEGGMEALLAAARVVERAGIERMGQISDLADNAARSLHFLDDTAVDHRAAQLRLEMATEEFREADALRRMGQSVSNGGMRQLPGEYMGGRVRMYTRLLDDGRRVYWAVDQSNGAVIHERMVDLSGRSQVSTYEAFEDSGMQRFTQDLDYRERGLIGEDLTPEQEFENVLTDLANQIIAGRGSLAAANDTIGEVASKLRRAIKDETKAQLDEFTKKMTEVENDIGALNTLMTKLTHASALTKPAFVAVENARNMTGMQRVNLPGLGDFAMPVPLAQEMLHRFKSLTGFHKEWRRFNSWWKTMATWLWPGFHVRNVMGAFFNNLIGGVGMDDYFAANRIARALHEVKTQPRDKWRWAKNKVKVKNPEIIGALRRQGYKNIGGVPLDELTYYDLGMLEVSMGVTAGNGRAFAEAELGIEAAEQAILGERPLERVPGLKHYFKLMRGTGTMTENTFRGAAFVHGIKNYGDLSEARAFTMVRHGDYADLTDLEYEWVRDLIPFYKWMRTNFPFQLHTLLENPGILATVPKAQETVYALAGRDYNEEKYKMPGWMQTQFTVPFPGDSEDAFNAVMLDLPVADLAIGTREFMSSFLPLARPFLESYVYEKSTFSGAPIEGKKVKLGTAFWPVRDLLNMVGVAERGEDGEFYISDKSQNILGILPVFARARNWLYEDPDRVKLRTNTVLSTAFGLGLRPVDQEQLVDTELDFYYTKVLPQIDALKQMGYPLPTTDDIKAAGEMTDTVLSRLGITPNTAMVG